MDNKLIQMWLVLWKNFWGKHTNSTRNEIIISNKLSWIFLLFPPEVGKLASFPHTESNIQWAWEEINRMSGISLFDYASKRAGFIMGTFIIFQNFSIFIINIPFAVID